MKKLLLSSMLLVAGLFAANAAEAEYDFSKQGFTNEQELDGVELKADQVTFVVSKGEGQTTPKYYNSGTALRMYSGNTITFSVPEGGSITKIDMVLAKQTYNMADDDKGYTASTGTFTADPKEARTASWSGSSDNLAISVNNAQNAAKKWPQFRIVSMTITYTAGVETKCSTPKFSVAEGTYYAAKEVELTTSTDGATIVYTINGGNETTYSAPIQLSDLGSYKIEAYAKKDGLENSDKATATYKIKAPVEVSDINDFIMQGESEPEKTAFKFTFPVTVTAQMPTYTYVQDDKGGAMLIYGSQVPTYKRGDVIPAGIVGEFINFNGLYEMQYPDASTFAAATSTKNLDDVVMNLGDVKDTDVNKIVYFDNVTYNETKGADNKTTRTLSDAKGGSINVYYPKGWNVEGPASGTEVDVIAAVAFYKKEGAETGTVQVYPIEFKAKESTPDMGSVESTVSAATVITTNANGVTVVAAEPMKVNVFNAAGQLVKSAMTSKGYNEIALPAGFYIVNAGGNVAKVIVK